MPTAPLHTYWHCLRMRLVAWPSCQLPWQAASPGPGKGLLAGPLDATAGICPQIRATRPEPKAPSSAPNWQEQMGPERGC